MSATASASVTRCCAPARTRARSRCRSKAAAWLVADARLDGRSLKHLARRDDPPRLRHGGRHVPRAAGRRLRLRAVGRPPPDARLRARPVRDRAAALRAGGRHAARRFRDRGAPPPPRRLGRAGRDGDRRLPRPRPPLATSQPRRSLHVRRVPPGHVLMWRDGHVTLRRYWRQPEWEPLARFSRPEEYVERFRELLTAAVADRVTGDRVAIPLSGGMDSPSIAAIGAVRAAREGRGRRRDQGGDGRARRRQRRPRGRLRCARRDPPRDRGGRRWTGRPSQPVDPFAEPVVLTPEPAWYRRTAFEYEIARVPSSHAPAGALRAGRRPAAVVHAVVLGRVARARARGAPGARVEPAGAPVRWAPPPARRA